MEKIFFLTGSIMGFLGVALGAFGAHALKDRLTPEMLGVFETGVRYQMYHAFALLAAAWAASSPWPHQPWVRMAGVQFIVGIVVFSGSLYALSLTGVRLWGAVTPLGGLAFLAGWACLFMAAL